MLQEASNGTLWNVLRGRFAAPQDEGGLGVRDLEDYGFGLDNTDVVCVYSR